MQELENADEKQRKAAEMTVRWDLKLTVTNKIGNFLHRNAFIGLLILSETGLLIFRSVADPRNSGISAKSREIPKKTRNTAKSARNISKYMSAKHI